MYDSQFAFCKNLIEKKIRGKIDEIYRELELMPFEIGSFEVQLTSHSDGEYFKWHRDNSTPETSSRRITFVYYFHAMPKRFSGGELIIYHGNEQHPIEPVNDAIVFFDSGRKHEVKQVACPGGAFKDSRFTLNGWIRCRTLRQLNNSYFGYNIFAPFKTSKYGV
jgi:Rps23 Pro-64 3,4-dihydroxylase Tpa1-like proline 4-hydroxylase